MESFKICVDHEWNSLNEAQTKTNMIMINDHMVKYDTILQLLVKVAGLMYKVKTQAAQVNFLSFFFYSL